jgi:hypothetical protein
MVKIDQSGLKGKVRDRSLAVLGLGLAARFFANRIAVAGVDDHRTGGNINPLGGSPEEVL